jgi:hypothetical protein
LPTLQQCPARLNNKYYLPNGADIFAPVAKQRSEPCAPSPSSSFTAQKTVPTSTAIPTTLTPRSTVRISAASPSSAASPELPRQAVNAPTNGIAPSNAARTRLGLELCHQAAGMHCFAKPRVLKLRPSSCNTIPSSDSVATRVCAPIQCPRFYLAKQNSLSRFSLAAINMPPRHPGSAVQSRHTCTANTAAKSHKQPHCQAVQSHPGQAAPISRRPNTFPHSRMLFQQHPNRTTTTTCTRGHLNQKNPYKGWPFVWPAGRQRLEMLLDY